MNVPKLRFKEFTDEWNSYKFYDLVSIINGQVNPNEKKYCNLPHIGPGNIEKGTGRLLEYNLAKDDKLISSKYLFNEKSVIYGKINPHFAKVCYPKCVGLCSADTYPINPIEGKLTSTFLLYLLLNPKFTKFATSVSMRTGMPKINRDELGVYNFIIPKINEQIKIGNTLELLDKKILLQTKKIEALKLFKLCISNLCFNDHKNWNYKISDFCDIITSTSKIKYIDSSGKRYIMDMGTINSDGNIIYSKPTNYDKDLLNKGDLIMPKDDIGGGLIIGKTAYIDQNNKYILGDHVFCLKNKNINSLYLHYLINSSCVNKSLRKKVTGSAQLGINSKNVLNQDIFVHEKKGQDVIANTLFKIDSKVLLNKIKLEKLLSLKKGFMQNMFI